MHQCTFGQPVVAYSDDKLLETITKKPLERAPEPLQGMLVQALQYYNNVQFLKGKEMFLNDTLRRAILPKTSDNGQEEFETTSAPTTQLKRTIQAGWPDNKSSLPSFLTPYFSIRVELATGQR